MLTRNTKIICAALLFLQIVIAHFILPAVHLQDFFPFYDWNLFSFTPRIQKIYFVRVHQLDGKKLDPPDLVLFKRDTYPARYKKALPLQIMHFGKILENKVANQERIESYKHVLERNLFTNYKSAAYEIDSAIVDIRETLQTKEIKEFTKLAQFEFAFGAAHP